MRYFFMVTFSERLWPSLQSHGRWSNLALWCRLVILLWSLMQPPWLMMARILQLETVQQLFCQVNRKPSVIINYYNDVIIGAMASQITSLTIVYSAVYSSADQRKKSTFRVTGLCVGNSLVTNEFPSQMASNAENVFIWLRHHGQHCCHRRHSRLSLWQPTVPPVMTKSA